MTALVSVETVLLVLLVVLVAGLLRSHAEILRRLGPGDLADDEGRIAPPSETAAAAEGGIAPPSEAARGADHPQPVAVTGTTVDGDAVTLAFEGAASLPTLLAFLTTGCGTCGAFWETLGQRRLPPEVQTVIVTRGPDREQRSRLRTLAPDGVPVVMSSQAWGDYRVPGAPYFVLIDGAVRGEGVATTWQALASLLGDAIEEQRELENGGARRARRVEETLAAAGIGADHPSLYPGRRQSSS
jgi:hypothetical protein